MVGHTRVSKRRWMSGRRAARCSRCAVASHRAAPASPRSAQPVLRSCRRSHQTCAAPCQDAFCAPLRFLSGAQGLLLQRPLHGSPCASEQFMVCRRLWGVEQLLPGSVFGSSRVFRRVPYSPVKCCWDGLGRRRGLWLPPTWRLLQPCAAQRHCCARAKRNLTVVVLQEERQEHTFAERRRAAAAAAADGTRLYATWPSTQRCSGCTSSLTAAAATAASLAAAAGAAEAEEVAAGAAAAAAAAAPTATACALSARRSRAATWTRCAAVSLPWGGAVDESLQPCLPGAGASLTACILCACACPV